MPASIEPLSPRVAERAGEPSGTAQLVLGEARPSSAAASPATCSRSGKDTPGRLEPLSPTRVRVEFTARAELSGKLERARELLSHALPSGDLGELFERALDALLEQETRKRFGAEKPRKARPLKRGSRHVPVGIERAVWERDGSQCTYVDAEGHRCSERRFITIEHRTPFTLGGPPTLDNLCLLCRPHNSENARLVFGESHIEAKIRARKQQPVSEATDSSGRPPVLDVGASEPTDSGGPASPAFDVAAKVQAALCQLGFSAKRGLGSGREGTRQHPLCARSRAAPTSVPAPAGAEGELMLRVAKECAAAR